MEFCFQNGSCEVRLARSAEEIIKAQELRYHIFYEVMPAIPTEECRRLRRDVDRFDSLCDHLLVIDKTHPDGDRVVGNYRLLCADSGVSPDYFYSHQEYDLTPLTDMALRDNLRLMELGRSCVHPDFRSNAIIQLLWRGIVVYAISRKMDVMFGCASFAGTDLTQIRPHLAYLYHHRLAPKAWRVRARDALYTNMQGDIGYESEREALAKMPPLVKGYLRVGAWIGDGAVIDPQFSTTDVFITLPVSNIPKRYIEFFGRSG